MTAQEPTAAEAAFAQKSGASTYKPRYNFPIKVDAYDRESNPNCLIGTVPPTGQKVRLSLRHEKGIPESRPDVAAFASGGVNSKVALGPGAYVIAEGFQVDSVLPGGTVAASARWVTRCGSGGEVKMAFRLGNYSVREPRAVPKGSEEIKQRTPVFFCRPQDVIKVSTEGGLEGAEARLYAAITEALQKDPLKRVGTKDDGLRADRIGFTVRLQVGEKAQEMQYPIFAKAKETGVDADGKKTWGVETVDETVARAKAIDYFKNKVVEFYLNMLRSDDVPNEDLEVTVYPVAHVAFSALSREGFAANHQGRGQEVMSERKPRKGEDVLPQGEWLYGYKSGLIGLFPYNAEAGLEGGARVQLVSPLVAGQATSTAVTPAPSISDLLQGMIADWKAANPAAVPSGAAPETAESSEPGVT